MSMSTVAPAPWYRHRWPWFLIAGPGIVIVASFVTLWLAIKSDDGLVADDYYKQGIAINRTLAQSEEARALGLAAHLRWQDGRIELRLATRPGVELPARLRLTLAHPTRAGLDHVVNLTGRDGLYGGAVANLTQGHWQIILEDEAAHWRLSGLAPLKPGAEIEFGADAEREK